MARGKLNKSTMARFKTTTSDDHHQADFKPWAAGEWSDSCSFKAPKIADLKDSKDPMCMIAFHTQQVELEAQKHVDKLQASFIKYRDDHDATLCHQQGRIVTQNIQIRDLCEENKQLKARVARLQGQQDRTVLHMNNLTTNVSDIIAICSGYMGQAQWPMPLMPMLMQDENEALPMQDENEEDEDTTEEDDSGDSDYVN